MRGIGAGLALPQLKDTKLIALRRAIAPLAILTIATSAALAQPVPGNKRDLDFDAILKAVDLEDPTLRFDYKKATTNGSSIGFYIGKGDTPGNASYVPTNTSSIPEAEVVSYRLSRFLGVSRIYYPVGYYKLGPKATARFRDMVEGTSEVWNDRQVNRKQVLKELDESPNELLGIYRLKPKTKLYSTPSLGSEGEINRLAPLAWAVRGGGPMPDGEETTLSGVKGGQKEYPTPPKEQTLELARQLSTILVIDQLIGQWDRFWGNLEASGDKNGRLKLMSRDNGGAQLDDWEGFDLYSKWVSRFDRDVVDRLTALNKFLKKETQEFSGFSSVEAWKEAAGFIAPKSFDMFKKKLAFLVEQRIPALIDKHGDDNTFFPAKSPETLARDAADGCDDD